jgi:hypothetical protein
LRPVSWLQKANLKSRIMLWVICVINRYAITGFVAASSGHPDDNTDTVISNNQVKWIQSCLSGSLILSSLL